MWGQHEPTPCPSINCDTLFSEFDGLQLSTDASHSKAINADDYEQINPLILGNGTASTCTLAQQHFSNFKHIHSVWDVLILRILIYAMRKKYSWCVLTMYCLKSIHCCTGVGCTEASTSRLALKFGGCSTQSAHADPAKHESRTLLPYTHATHPCYHRRPWRWRKRLAHESQGHHAASVRCSTSARHS